MHRVQRSTILYLVAVGRMTPEQAERLLGYKVVPVGEAIAAA